MDAPELDFRDIPGLPINLTESNQQFIQEQIWSHNYIF